MSEVLMLTKKKSECLCEHTLFYYLAKMLILKL